MSGRDIAALVEFLDARLAMPHDWDGNCCVRFVLGAVKAQFGKAPDLKVKWHDEASARRAIARVRGIEKKTDKLFRSIEPAQAKFGDIAGIEDPELGFTLAIVEGHTLVAPGERGLVRRPRAAMVRAWSAEPRNG